MQPVKLEEIPLQRMQVLAHRHALDGFDLFVVGLDRNPDPTETEVRYWLAGNLCRCTGYDKIIRSVLAAAKEMRGV